MPTLLRRLRALLRLQFSLRAVLVLFGLIGIALAVWRWPWQEESVSGPFPVLEAPTGYASMHGKIVRTRAQYRRGWWGEKLRSGPAESFDIRNRLVARLTWYDGRLHGPETWFDLAGQPIVEQTRAQGKLHGPFRYGDGFRWRFRGEYANEKRTGPCSDDEEWLSGLTIERIGEWQDGRLQGPCRWQVAGTGEVLNRGVFEKGVLVEWNGQPVHNHLPVLALRGEITADPFAEMLRDNDAERLPYTRYEIQGVKVFFHDGNDRGGTLQIDPTLRLNFIPQQLSVCPGVLPAHSASDELLATLIPWGMTIDVRYGQLWIVPLEDQGLWRDPTGVNRVVPVKNSKLADLWRKSHYVAWSGLAAEAVPHDPLQEVFKWWPEQTEVVVDVASHFPKLHERWTRTEIRRQGGYANAHWPSLVDWIGTRLYQAGLQCELEGNRLVILPHWSRSRLPDGT